VEEELNFPEDKDNVLPLPEQKKPSILILDEATSSLDESEKLVQERLKF
jgi:ABC-type iron transport system FetAB ATPase subunit